MTENFRLAGQSHVAADLDQLTEAEQAELNTFIQQTDFIHLNRVLEASLALLNNAAPDSEITPPPPECIFDVEREKALPRGAADGAIPSSPYETYVQKGYHLIADGKAAVLLLAGGSGTRLGVSYPKGLFTYEHETSPDASRSTASTGEQPANYLLKQHSKSLFQFHCERLRRIETIANEACRRAGLGPHEAAQHEGTSPGKIRLLVMTSQQNDGETQRFFQAHDYFGLDRDQVSFFRQSSLPVYDAAVHEGDVDSEGRPVHRVLMETKGKPLLAPGGNGGVYESLASRHNVTPSPGGSSVPAESPHSVLDELVCGGVQYVQIFSVDNLLAKIGDPVFYGYTAARNCHVTVKTTPKVGPDERVGVFAKINRKWGVVEYTELGNEKAAMRCPVPPGEDGDTGEIGDLVFNCANIASHCCSVTFLRFAAAQMKKEVLYHAAIKKVKVNGGVEERVGIKLEAFIFDMFRHCNEAVVEEFEASAANAETETAESDRFGILQVDRQQEFAPIKNATETAATDNPRTAAQLYVNMTTKWVRDYLFSLLPQHTLQVTNHLPKQSICPTGEADTRSDEQMQKELTRVEEAVACLAPPLPMSGNQTTTAEVTECSTKRPSANGTVFVEVSPLVSYAGEGLGRYRQFIITSILKAHSSPPGAGRNTVLLDETVEPDRTSPH